MPPPFSENALFAPRPGLGEPAAAFPLVEEPAQLGPLQANERGRKHPRHRLGLDRVYAARPLELSNPLNRARRSPCLTGVREPLVGVVAVVQSTSRPAWIRLSWL